MIEPLAIGWTIGPLCVAAMALLAGMRRPSVLDRLPKPDDTEERILALTRKLRS